MSDQSRIAGTAVSVLSSQRELHPSYDTSLHTIGYPQPMTAHTPHMPMAQHLAAQAQNQRLVQSPHSFKTAAPPFQPLNSSNIYLQDSSTLRQDPGRRTVSDNYSMLRPRPQPAGIYDASTSVIRSDGSWIRANPAANGVVASPIMHSQQQQPQPPPPPPQRSSSRMGPPLDNNQGQVHVPPQVHIPPQAQAQLGRPIPQNAYSTQARQNEAEIRMRNEAQMRVLRRNMGNAGVLRVLDVIDLVSLGSPDQLCNLVYWQRLVAGNFLPSSLVTIHLGPSAKHYPDPRSDEGNISRQKQQLPVESKAGFTDLLIPQSSSAYSRLYKLQMATFPRFLLAAALDLQVAKLDMTLGFVECQVLSNAFINMSGRVVLQYVYVDGSRATVNGRFNLQLNRELRILLIDYWVIDYTPSINLDRLTQELELAHSHNRGNPKSFAASLAETCHAKQRTASFGFGEAAIRSMKLSDVMVYLKPIINLGALRRINSPHQAMELFVAMSQDPSSNNPRRTDVNSIKEGEDNSTLVGPGNGVKRPAGPAFELNQNAANAPGIKIKRR